MVLSSFLPIRRKRISSRPATGSNLHNVLYFTTGTGNGQSLSPMRRILLLLCSPTSSMARVISRNEGCRAFASATGSPDSTICRLLALPPRTETIRLDLPSRIAATSRSTASSGDVKNSCAPALAMPRHIAATSTPAAMTLFRRSLFACMSASVTAQHECWQARAHRRRGRPWSARGAEQAPPLRAGLRQPFSSCPRHGSRSSTHTRPPAV